MTPSSLPIRDFSADLAFERVLKTKGLTGSHSVENPSIRDRLEMCPLAPSHAYISNSTVRREKDRNDWQSVVLC